MSRTKRIRITDPMSPNTEIKTREGILTAKEWLKKEKERIKKANSERKPTIEPCGKNKNQYALFANEPQPEERTQW